MSTALQLHQIIDQLADENVGMLESYAEFLLQQQREHPVKKNKKEVISSGLESTSPIPDQAWEDEKQKKQPKQSVSERLKKLRKHAGKAKFPDTPTDKYAVYEQ